MSTQTIIIPIQLGRPVNPNSVRQQQIKERLAKQEAGLLKKGRPVIEGSKRQEALKKREEKLNNGVELKKGRPVNPDSKRQVELIKKAQRAMAIQEALVTEKA
jgi:hypothetical protein